MRSSLRDTWHSVVYQNLLSQTPFDDFYFPIFYHDCKYHYHKNILEDTPVCFPILIFR